MTEQSTALVVFSKEAEQERLTLLANYHPHDHLAKWLAFDKNLNRKTEVVYYPAAWRLYELNLRYPLANMESEIVHMNEEKDFVIVRARLYLGPDYQASPKRAQAFKQGKLSELDRVETKAKARAARDFGIGTEHALDMDEAESVAAAGEASAQSNGHALNVVEADRTPADTDLLTSTQLNSLRQLYELLGREDPGNLTTLRFGEAKTLIRQMKDEYAKSSTAGAGR